MQELCRVQVHLGDKPAIAMSQRMSAAIWNGTAPYLGAALLLSLATVASATTHVLPSNVLPLPAIIALGVLGKGLFSVLGPLLEIQKLSKMSAQDIEAAVDLREPLQVSLCLTTCCYRRLYRRHSYVTALCGEILVSLLHSAHVTPFSLGLETTRSSLGLEATVHTAC